MDEIDGLGQGPVSNRSDRSKLNERQDHSERHRADQAASAAVIAAFRLNETILPPKAPIASS
jgi:hypothetical protein